MGHSTKLKSAKSQSGFTLVELMIVVTIIGILASFASVKFAKYKLQAKAMELPVVMQGIKTHQEAFAMRWGAYSQTKASHVVVPTGDKNVWKFTEDRGFDLIGFKPAGRTYFQYTVVSGDRLSSKKIKWKAGKDGKMGVDSSQYPCASGAGCKGAKHLVTANGDPSISVLARADLDNDGQVCIYGVTDKMQDVRGHIQGGKICGAHIF